VFLGSGLARLLCSVYNQLIASMSNDVAEYRQLVFRPTDADSQAIEGADLVVAQIGSLQVRDAVAEIAGTARLHLFPTVAAQFLWPFGGQAHPRNRSSWRPPDGPYPAALGDAFLNRMIDREIDPDVAAQRYLDLDVNTVVDLDQMLEIGIAQQQERDQATGYSYAGMIAQTFREACLFVSSEQPSASFARSICFDVLSRVDAKATALARQQFAALTFAADALPIHPSVIRHFDLRFLPDTPRYPYLSEGSFTFPEYVRRYLHCARQRDLGEGIGLPEPGRRSQAQEDVIRSPYAAPGLIALSKLLADDNQIDKAVLAVQRAIEIAPESLAYHDRLGELLMRQEKLSDAIDVLRRAVTLNPQDAPRRAFLSVLLLRAKRHDEAEAEIRRAIELVPTNSDFHDRLGHVLNAQGRHLEGIDAFLQAAKLNPQNAPLHAHLSNLLQYAGRLEEAEAAIRHAVGLAPENNGYRDMLHRLLAKWNRDAETTAASEPARTTPDLPARTRPQLAEAVAASEAVEPAHATPDLFAEKHSQLAEAGDPAAVRLPRGRFHRRGWLKGR
jgi:tetratricopeptide (TPR) repeat protein